jgi:hypothetical protein
MRQMRPIPLLRCTVLGTAAFLAFADGFAAPAMANLIITPIFDTTITSDPNAGIIQSTINGAIAVYESAISTSINVGISFAEMSSGLGSSSTYYSTVSYQSYISALAPTASSGATDTTALASLPISSVNPVTGATTIDVKTANLRAIGLNVNPPAGQPDGFISLNTSLTNPGSAGTSSQYSLLAVIEHEINEVLGLGSGLNTAATIFPEDLFRYAANGARSYASSPTAAAYFSLNGTNDLAQFNNVANGADFGDWASGATPRVQDAYGTPYTSPTLGPNELMALDAIGYNLAPVPEPASLAVLATSIGGLVTLRRRRRQV